MLTYIIVFLSGCIAGATVLELIWYHRRRRIHNKLDRDRFGKDLEKFGEDLEHFGEDLEHFGKNFDDKIDSDKGTKGEG